MDTKKPRTPKIGEVYLVELEGSDSEQAGRRPCVIFQNNKGNYYSPNVIVIPLTSSLKKLNMPTHVLLRASENNLGKDSVAICENPCCVSKERIGRYLTRLSDSAMQEIAIANMMATSAIAFVDLKRLASIQAQAARLNAAVA